MCTVTWILDDHTVELWTNRDEQRSRTRAEPPAVRRGARLRYLAPRDVDGGGTWVAANEAGVVVCLLNHWEAEEPRLPASRLLSRGSVVADLAGRAESTAAAAKALGRLDLERLRGFQLLVLAAGSMPLHASWDRHAFRLDDGAAVAMPLVSSSFELERVRAARQRAFRDLVRAHGGIGPKTLDAFHRSEHPEPGPLAVSMSRPDAATVSLTRVLVDPTSVALHYEAGAPARRGPVVRATLPRLAARHDVA
jgi:hypothetical protein